MKHAVAEEDPGHVRVLIEVVVMQQREVVIVAVVPEGVPVLVIMVVEDEIVQGVGKDQKIIT